MKYLSDKPYIMFSCQIMNDAYDHFIVDRNYIALYYKIDHKPWVRIKHRLSYEPPTSASAKYLSEEELFVELL